MVNVLKLKRSATPSEIPLPGDLEYGELAINYADGVVYFKDSTDTIQTVGGGDLGPTGPTGPAGADGVDGVDGVFAFLTNDSHVVQTAADGSGADFGDAGGTFTVFDGTSNVTTGSGITYSVFSETGVDVSINSSTGVYTVSSMSASQGTATLRAVYGSITMDRVYTIAKALAGNTGPTGPTGPRGATWTSGSTVPDNGDGLNGDYYLRTGTGDVYLKSAGTWSVVDNITGPEGSAGPAGPAGSAFYSWDDVAGDAVPQSTTASSGLIHTFGPVINTTCDGLAITISYKANAVNQVTVAFGDFSYTDVRTLDNTSGNTRWTTVYVPMSLVSGTADNFLSIYAPGTVTALVYAVLVSPIAGNAARVPYDGSSGITLANSAGAQLMNEAASGTNPTLVPRKDDVTSGIGANATGQVSVIAGGTERIRAHSTGASVTGDLGVTGGLSAATKSFLIPHPSKPGYTLRHGSLEGPENGVYARGRTASPVVQFPDYWLDLVDETTITVHVTAIGGGSLHVKQWDGRGFSVGYGLIRPREYTWVAYAERKDVAKLILETETSAQ